MKDSDAIAGLQKSLSETNSYLDNPVPPPSSSLKRHNPPTTTLTDDEKKPPPHLPLQPRVAQHSPAVSNTRNDYFQSPRFNADELSVTTTFRDAVRSCDFTGPTNGKCPGFLQCNLVVLRKAQAYDFLLFCQRNPRPCPLVEVCDEGSFNPNGVARWADLRTDLPAYNIYRNGELEESHIYDVKASWPTDSVAFLIGCSFTFDSVLQENRLTCRSIDLGTNIPMYRTNLKCRPSGRFRGNIVVTMRPF